MSERFNTLTRPNKLTRTTLAVVVGGTALFTLVKSEASAHENSRSAHVVAASSPPHDIQNEVRQLRSQMVKEEQLQAARDAARLAHSTSPPSPISIPKAAPVQAPPMQKPVEAKQVQTPAQAKPKPTDAVIHAGNDPANEQLAQQMAVSYGWTGTEWVCLDKLWTRESHFRATDKNPNSGAYGIPQAKPGEKMASAGNDWANNPVTQISWGLGYISSRYGTPCAAEAHSEQTNWY